MKTSVAIRLILALAIFTPLFSSAHPEPMYVHGHLQVDHFVVETWDSREWKVAFSFERGKEYRYRLALMNNAPANIGGPRAKNGIFNNNPYWNLGTIYDLEITILLPSNYFGVHINNKLETTNRVIIRALENQPFSPLKPQKGMTIVSKKFTWQGPHQARVLDLPFEIEDKYSQESRTYKLFGKNPIPFTQHNAPTDLYRDGDLALTNFKLLELNGSSWQMARSLRPKTRYRLEATFADRGRYGKMYNISVEILEQNKYNYLGIPGDKGTYTAVNSMATKLFTQTYIPNQQARSGILVEFIWLGPSERSLHHWPLHFASSNSKDLHAPNQIGRGHIIPCQQTQSFTRTKYPVRY